MQTAQELYKYRSVVEDEIHDPMLSVNLYDHQKEGIRQTLRNAQGFANFAEQGTGKTLITMGAMNILAQADRVKRVLIVCPNTVKGVWEEEMKKSILRWDVKVLNGNSKKRMEDIGLYSKITTPYIIITNYESLLRIGPLLSKLNFDLVIADEAASIKNHRAKKTKFLKAIKSKYRWALTGTPVVQNVLDVWSIFDWIRPGHMSSNFYAFRNRYCVVFTGAGFPIIRSFKNLAELKTKSDKYSWRVLKEECLDIPEKIFTVREFELDPSERRIYNEMSSLMITEVGNKEIVAQTALVRMLRLQQITSGFINTDSGTVKEVGGSKLSALREILEELNGKKVVVWTKFRHEVKMIESVLNKMKRHYVKVTGSETTEERQKSVKEFQIRDDKDTVFIANIQVGGTGLTLTEASHCVYYSNSWSLGDRIQSADRLHRIGQRNPVTYYDLVASRTIDKYVLKVISKKAKLSDKLTGDDIRRMACGGGD